MSETGFRIHLSTISIFKNSFFSKFDWILDFENYLKNQMKKTNFLKIIVIKNMVLKIDLNTFRGQEMVRQKALESIQASEISRKSKGTPR